MTAGRDCRVCGTPEPALPQRCDGAAATHCQTRLSACAFPHPPSTMARRWVSIAACHSDFASVGSASLLPLVPAALCARGGRYPLWRFRLSDVSCHHLCRFRSSQVLWAWAPPGHQNELLGVVPSERRLSIYSKTVQDPYLRTNMHLTYCMLDTTRSL